MPIGPSREYVAAARSAGDKVELVELERCGHMDFLDPQSAAHGALLGWLARVCGRPTEG